MLLEDDQGRICSWEEETEREWLKYVQRLYSDDDRKPTVEIAETEKAPEITMSELERALKKA